MSTTVRFTNIAQIKAANKAAGRFWFSPDTVRYFRSKVETRVYEPKNSLDYPQGSRVWVESTSNYDHSAREYKIARYNLADHDISWVSLDYRTLVFDTKTEAVKFLEGQLL